MSRFILISIEVTEKVDIYRMAQNIKDQIYLMYPYSSGPIISPIVIETKES